MFYKDNRLVLVYKYDPELFFFTRMAKAQIHNGRLLKPEASTLIPPPKCNDENLIPVFNETENSWTLRKALDLKLKRRRITFCLADYDYSNRFSNQLIPNIFNIERPDNIGDKSVVQIGSQLSSLEKLGSFINPFSANLFVAQRIVYLNNQINNLYRQYAAFIELFKRGSFCNLQQSQYFYFQEVDIIHNTLVVALYLENNENPDNDLACDGLGYLLDKKESGTRTKIKEKIDFDYYEDLLTVINNLHNGYKHEILTEQLPDKFYLEPCLHLNKFHTTTKDKRRIRDLQHVICFEIDLRKLIYACNDFLTFLINGKRNAEISRFQKVETDMFVWTK